MRLCYCLIVSIALGTAPLVLYAEVFVLRSGGRIEGEHLNPDRSAGQAYQVRTDDGVRLALAESAVQRVVTKTDIDKQYETLLPKVPNTVEGHWSMAEWCKEAGLVDQRKRHLAAVVALDPNHADARKALGYSRYGARWMLPEEYMQSQGYVRYKGAWRLKQEIDIDTQANRHELAAKQFRRDIRRWLEQVASGGRHAETAERELNAINDPDAAPALAEILADTQQPRAVRQRCLDILGRLPPGLAMRTLINIAMDDPDANIQDACLSELKREGAPSAVSSFVSQLKSKDNTRVNRAAECLQRLGDKSATLPLINALVTEHKFLIQQGGSPGGMSATFGNGGSGSNSPGGGLSMGGKPKEVKQKLPNPSVRAALATLHPGVNYQYDIDAWRSWYTTSQTTASIDLRRDP
jgi:hypothetical protein